MRVCLAIAFAMIALAASSGDLVPVSAFARLPQVSGFDVSPSGDRVLMFQPAGDSLHLVVIDLVAKTTRLALASDPDQFFFNWCRFANETRILCSVRAYIKLVAAQNSLGFRWYRDGRVTVTRLFGVDHDGTHFTEMVPEKVTHPGEDLVWNSQFQDRIVNWLPDDDEHVLIQLNRKDRSYPDVYRLDVNRNKIELVAKYSPPISFWEAADSGKIMHGCRLSRSGAGRFCPQRKRVHREDSAERSERYHFRGARFCARRAHRLHRDGRRRWTQRVVPSGGGGSRYCGDGVFGSGVRCIRRPDQQIPDRASRSP